MDHRLRRRRPAGVGDRRRRRHHPFAWDVCDRLVATVARRAAPTGSPTTPRAGWSSRHVGGRTWRVDVRPRRPGHVARPTPLGATTRYALRPRGQAGRRHRPARQHGADPLRRARQRRRRCSTRSAASSRPRYDAMRRPVAVTDQLGRTTRSWTATPPAAPSPASCPPATWSSGSATPRAGHRRPGQRARRHRVRPRPRRAAGARPRAGPQPHVHPRLDAGRPPRVPRRRRRHHDVAAATATARRLPARRRRRHHGLPPRSGRAASPRSSATGWGTVELDRDPDGRLVALRAPGVDPHVGATTPAAWSPSPPRRAPDGAARTASHTRDAAGRVTETAAPRAPRRYRYDAAGQIVAATTPRARGPGRTTRPAG